VLPERRSRAGARHVGRTTFFIDQSLTVTRHDGFASEHVAR